MPLPVQAQTVIDKAAQFGALESIRDVSLSPDGTRIAFVENGEGMMRRLHVVDTAEGALPRQILSSDGENGFLSWCGWVTNSRLVCGVYFRDKLAGEVMGASRIIAVDAAGGNLKMLSNRRSARALFRDFRGGDVIDWSASDKGSVLMSRTYVPENNTGTNIADRSEGLGVDRVDASSGSSKRVVSPNRDAIDYLSDGHGQVRIMATRDSSRADNQLDPQIRYLYRIKGQDSWKLLSTYDIATEAGFYPIAIDPATDRAFGLESIDGRKAVVAKALDGSETTTTIFKHDQVDVDDIVRIGRNGRIVGVSYATDRRVAVLTDPKYAKLTSSLSKALGGKQILVADASADESRLLIRASSDVDPGQYFLYDATAMSLRPLLGERDALAEMALSPVKPINYPAADGVMVPGYLTLPPGRTDAKGLPAIVMPHGGPSARDEWGFDWLAQYFAQMGYAVLQPNFRGSSGYGDQWYQQNGFRSWRTAIGDVTDGGRWLVSGQGADPARLSIVGWSYGGYAALQSGVLAPDLFKAIVAIAPVTDLEQLRAEEFEDGGGAVNVRYIGTGPHIREGSPAQNAGTINSPVLMFHGTFDQSVRVAQARTMKRALEERGKSVDLVEYPELGHSLETREARSDMLRKIAAFLPK
jgi:dipeptidyl aminopeptidase/acylaminoacyl peptidase